MSVLVHLCDACDHQAAWHEPRSQGYTSCPCCRAGTTQPAAQPTIVATFGFPGWQPEPLLPPGSPRNVGTMHATTTCDCSACHAAFAAHTGHTA